MGKFVPVILVNDANRFIVQPYFALMVIVQGTIGKKKKRHAVKTKINRYTAIILSTLYTGIT